MPVAESELRPDLRLGPIGRGGLPGPPGAARAQVAHLLELRQVYAVLVENETAWWGLFPTPARAEMDVREYIRVLTDVVSAYEGLSRLERIKLADYEQLPQMVQAVVQHQVCLFPLLHKEELLLLAAQGTRI